MMRPFLLALSLGVTPLAASLSLFAMPSTGYAQQSPQTQSLIPTIHVETVHRQTFQEVSRIDGSIKAKDRVTISSSLDSLQVTALNVDVGDVVKKGQVLLKLDDTQLTTKLKQAEAAIVRSEALILQQKASLEEAKASMVEATAQMKRVQALHEKGYASNQVLDSQKAATTTATARMRAAETTIQSAEADLFVSKAQKEESLVALQKTIITAPVSGIISSRTVALGDTVRAGTALLGLIKDRQLEFQAEVPQYRLSTMRTGQAVNVFPTGHETPVQGKIRVVSPEIQEETRLGMIYVTLPLDPFLQAGSFAQGDVLGEQKSGLLIPQTALLSEPDGKSFSVLVLKDQNKVRRQAVTLGGRSGKMIEALTGLAENDRIVSVAGPFLSDGDTIQPITAQNTNPTPPASVKE